MRRSTDITSVVQARLLALVGRRDEMVHPSDGEPVVLDVDPRATRSVARAVIAVVVLVGIAVWLNRPVTVVPLSPLATGIPLQAASQGPVTTVVVDVEGDVRKPGLVTLPAGSRVADAISAAGGFTRKNASQTINLAARLEDGQQIVVGGVAAGASSSDTRVSLNSATVTDFDTLPGVGPVLAGRIVAWRTQHQHFASIDELQEVPGIGPKVFANLKALVRL